MKTFNSIITILIASTLLIISQSISFTLKQPKSHKSVIPKRCFLSTVFKQQKLLIQLQLPLINSKVQANIQVSIKQKNPQNNKIQKKVVLKQAINHIKYQTTLNKSTHEVNQLKNQESLEYETCLFLSMRSSLTTNKATASEIAGELGVPSPSPTPQQQILATSEPQIYLFRLKLLTNFTYVLQQKRNSSPINKHEYTKQNLKKLRKYSQKLYLIAKEQVVIHRQNQKMEQQTQNHLKNIQDSIYSASIMQSALLVFGSLTHINLMRGYLKGKV